MPPRTIGPDRAYIPFIDGMRALAVLVILGFHLDMAVLSGGFIGVDIFFVISGYLITGHIVTEIQNGRFSLRNFYARRIKRIFPALFFMLLLVSFAAVFFLGPSGFSDFFKTSCYAAMQVSNFLFMGEVDYFDHGRDINPLLHTWSLGVEEQYYLLWPLCLMVFWARLLKQRFAHYLCLGIIVVSLLISEYLVRTEPQIAFYMLHSRAWELSLGALAALWPLMRHRKILSGYGAGLISALALGVILSCAVFYNAQSFPGFKAFPPCAAAALLLYIARHRETAVHHALGVRPLTRIGLLSYSLYLWHWPLIAIYKYYFSAELSADSILWLVTLSVIMACISYFLVEKPLRYTRLSPQKTIAVALAMMILFIPITNLVKREKEAPWRTTVAFERAVTERSPYFVLCGYEGGAYDKENCIIGPNKDRYEVILAGDSHAAHYAPAVLGFAQEHGLTVRFFFRGNCRAFVQEDAIPIHKGKRDDYCMKMQDDFYTILDEEESIKYVFVALMGGSDQADLFKSLERIKAYQKETYYLGRVPVFNNDPLECQIRSTLLATKIFPRDAEEQQCLEFQPGVSDSGMALVYEKLVPYLQQLDIGYFDPARFMMNAFDEKGHFMYMDNTHLNIYGGQYLASHLDRFVRGTRKAE